MIGGTVIIASDATGDTGERVVRAALAQFSGHENVRVVVSPHVRDEAAIHTILEQSKRQGALLVYTLVDHTLRALVRRLAEEMDVRAVDLLGGLLIQMHGHFGQAPEYKPGLGHELDAAYFKRVEAVEFAVNNDDGREPRNLRRADIVLVGISRTSKTPLSSYIAHRGYRVANVPVVVDIPLPKELDLVDPRRVFALLIDPLVLGQIRKTRMKHMGMEPGSGYGDLKTIRQELEYCRALYAKHPDWTSIDITGKAIEETASSILERYRTRFEAGNGGGQPPTTPFSEPPPASPPRSPSAPKKA